MATAAQILANQANAQHSTGPATGAGKARSSRNNLQHGLTLGVLAVAPGEEAAFRQFEAKFRAECRPQGALECEALQQFIDAAWRLRAIRSIVGQMFEEHKEEPFVHPETEAKFRQLNRYRAAAEMIVYRAIKTLRELQSFRLFRNLNVTPEEQEVIPPLVNPGEKFWCGGEMKLGHNDRELFYRVYGPEPLTSRFPPPDTGARVTVF
jgi:hypothetical protein